MADTGATSNFFQLTQNQNHYVHTAIPLKNVQPTNHGIQVLLPNKQTMQATHTGELDIPHLPPAATKAHIFPHLASGSLLSIGQLCDSGCTALFTATKLYILYQGKLVLQGQRTINGHRLWTINPTTTEVQQDPPTFSDMHSLNAAIDQPTLANRIKFYQASLFSPTLDTLCKAIDAGYLTTFPEFTTQQVRRHAGISEATIKGHLHAQRANLRSTKKTHKTSYHLYNLSQTPSPSQSSTGSSKSLPTLIPPDDDDDYKHITSTAPNPSYSPTEPQLPPSSPPSRPVITPSPSQSEPPASLPFVDSIGRTQHVYAGCHTITGKIATDQTGQFLVPSTSGNKYVFTLYDYDSNVIIPQAIPNRTKLQLHRAFSSITKDLKRRGLTPQLQYLDNEASKHLKEYMRDQNIEYQLTPAGIHRRNMAERAIQTFKNHFIAGLSSVHPNFPLNLWDKLLPQAMITLNLLRPSRINPRLSAYSQLYGMFDYNKHPIAPPGMKILTHVLPQLRKSWAPHAEDGFYLGPAMEHYRCHRVWINKTSAERIAQTVKWLPHNSIKMPFPDRESIIIAAINDLTSAIKMQDTSPLLPPVSTSTRTTLQHLQSLFDNPLPTTATPGSNSTAHQYSTPTLSSPPIPRVARVPPLPSLPPPQNTPQPKVSQPSNITTTTASEPRVTQSSSPLPTRASTPSTTLRKTILQTTNQHPQATRRSTRPRKLSQKLQALQVLIERNNAVMNPLTGKLQEYRDLIKGPDRDVWMNGCSKEFARLTKGRKADDTPGNNTIVWLHPKHLPPGKRATYMRICANFRPQKADPHRIRCTVGGNLIQYDGPIRTPTADLTLFKLFINSIISTPNAKFTDVDLADFYIKHKLPEPEYMLVPYSLFPPDIIDEYDIKNKVDHRGLVLAKIIGAMYGLPQAGRIAYEELKKYLAEADYVPTGHTPGLFKHRTRPIQFILVVDDFGIKFETDDDLQHLLTHLRKKYKATQGDGTLFCGIKMKWDYKNRIVELSMPNYVDKALKRFNHPSPKAPQHSPHAHTRPQYGVKQQMAQPVPSDYDALTKAEKKYVQEVVGTFLFYARAIDATMLPALGTIATGLTILPFYQLKQKINQLMDYAATHSNASIKYIASAMHLWAHTDASYLSEFKARSRAGGFHFLSDKPHLPIKSNSLPPTLNGPVNTISKIIDAVMSSAQEAETGAGYLNAKELVPMRQALIEMGHPQGPTPLQFDNQCATGILNNDMQQKRSKAMDMRFYWLKDRAQQNQFHIHWKKGETNLADYPTKHHPSAHHQAVRHFYVQEKETFTPVNRITAKIG